MSDSEEDWHNLLYEACYIRDKRIAALEEGLADALEWLSLDANAPEDVRQNLLELLGKGNE